MVDLLKSIHASIPVSRSSADFVFGRYVTNVADEAVVSVVVGLMHASMCCRNLWVTLAAGRDANDYADIVAALSLVSISLGLLDATHGRGQTGGVLEQ